jgi:hypothetical protein
MASFLLKFLRILLLARHHIGRISCRWALFIALLDRKLSQCWRRWPGKPGPSRNTKLAKSSFSGNGAISCSSASGGPAVLGEYATVVIASNVPASASQGSIHERAQRQPSTAPSPMPVTLSVGQSHSPDPYRERDYLAAGNLASRGSSNVSIASSQSRASDRLSIIITASREALHAPVGQLSELPRSAHHQFGRGPDPSRSGGRLSRPPSPTPPLTTTQQPLDIIQTVVRFHADAGEGISPTDWDLPPSSSNTPEPQSTPLTRKKQRTSSLDVHVHVQSPSLESLAIACPTANDMSAHSSVSDHHGIASPRHSTAESEFYLPEGRFLQLINSEQIPRYSKHIRMQVDSIITFIQSSHLLTDLVRKDRTFKLWNP